MANNGYSLVELRAMKPARMSERQWDKLIHRENGVEMLTFKNDELVTIPLSLSPASRKVERVGRLGTFNVETGKPVKQQISKKMPAKMARRMFGHGGYEYNTSQPEIAALAKSAKME